jgi:tRNA U34 5-methylaminomethyl-2-thiouridine-forming methyltransferase MnmC
MARSSSFDLSAPKIGNNVQKGAGYKLVKVAGGTHSLHSLDYGETFHPVIGPVAEAEALYVRQTELRERLKHHKGEFVMWDVGLGAAANAVTVLKATEDLDCKIRLVSFDHTIEPADFALRHVEALEYLRGYEERIRDLITTHHMDYRLGNQQVVWDLHVADFPALLRQSMAAQLPKPHAILFDAFSPATNPAMWTLSLFTDLFQLLDPQRPCVLPTYSRSTMLRVTLLLAGFFVGVGHATGEKEETTLAANTMALIREPLPRTWLKRVRRSTSAEPLTAPVYRQAPPSEQTIEKLEEHPQFR